MLNFAYYVTGHGLGHATRVAEVCKQILKLGHCVYVVTAAPEWAFRLDLDASQQKLLHYRKVVLDYGAKQADALTVDRVGSLEEYFKSAVVHREELLQTESAWLQNTKINLVVSDIVPLACAAAEQAGIASVCIGNFSWDFVYAEYLTAVGTQQEPHLHNIVWQIAVDYSTCHLLLRLPGYTPMPAFREVQDVPLLTRKANQTRQQVRARLGISETTKVLVYQFGGHAGSDWALRASFLPSGWTCIVCGVQQQLPTGGAFIAAPQDAYIPDLVQAADAVLGKIGYGTASECLAHNVPLVFVRRSYFNEEPFLRKLLELNDCMVEMTKRDFFGGNWQPYLARALQLKPTFNEPVNGGEVIAKALEEVGQKSFTQAAAGSQSRLRDAVVFGYHLARAHTDQKYMSMDVPDWYTSPLSPKKTGPDKGSNSSDIATARMSDLLQHVTLKHGSARGLADTEAFLLELVALKTSGAEDSLPENRAAAGLFRWDEDLVITRAPGRLDVMGGIADYSGSLVLEMPTAEACHVALQRQPPSGTQVAGWKHVQERHKRAGGGGEEGLDDVPTLRIVSFGADNENRAPAFDMDMKDFFEPDTGEPISYEKARVYFQQDVSRSWWCSEGMSVLVSSRVPEGKGVSSSAAVEVAALSAITAAFQLTLDPKHTALLAQKVENLVVGAPCGVMDQMTSVCGQSDKLLALQCRPAEIIGLVDIPPHVKFWGIDSGIRHSVGGSDYGSVRVGAFMGRRIILDIISAKAKTLETNGNTISKDFHLASIPPHEYTRSYEEHLPESITGSKFLQQFGYHQDAVTQIEPHRTYAVRAPTQHPIHENFRTELFMELLKAPDSRAQLSALGELMFQAHLSYTRCGLASPETDSLVRLVQEVNCSGNLFGAKITGGGSGGTVCILGKADENTEEDIQSLVHKYKTETLYEPYVFRGSSPGSAEFGHIVMQIHASSSKRQKTV